ncbi:MAG TPA: 2'-5' RNA ligase family protein [Candidatus Saccharimonadales bacterium]|nr:2'-5' RNA ligase family protein [Candidatus Saccharimonadales bacterium]
MEDEPYQEVYFIGIALPTELERRIARLKNRLYKNDPELLRPVLPHVTLLHPPSLQGVMPSQLIPKVRQVADRYLPLTIALTDVGNFGDSVVFMNAQSLKLQSLQSQLVKLLPPEAQELHYRRSYHPHITIAQKYEPKPLDRAFVTKQILNQFDLPLSFTVDNISYFRRILPRRYKPEDI